MLYKNFLFFICAILFLTNILAIHTPCFSMDQVNEDLLDASDQNVPKKKRKSEPTGSEKQDFQTVFIDDENNSVPSPHPDIDLKTIPSLIDGKDHPLRKELNELLYKTALAQHRTGQSAPIWTSLAAYYKHKGTTNKDWDNYALLFKDLDEKFFIESIAKKTRVVQVITTCLYALSPIAMGSLVLYLTGPLLGTEDEHGVLPVGGVAAYSLLGSVYVFTLPVCLVEGWNFGKQVGHFLFDNYGLKPQKPNDKTSKLHKYTEKNPIGSRLLSYLGAVARTAPYTILYWKSQMPFPPTSLATFFKTLVFPLSLNRFTRAYNENMDFSNHRVLSDKQRVLITSLKSMQDLINGMKSKEIVDSLHTHLQTRKQTLKEDYEARKKFTARIKALLIRNVSQSIPQEVNAYIEAQLIVKNNKNTFLQAIQEKLKKTTPAAIKELIEAQKRGSYEQGHSFQFTKENAKPLMREIKRYIENTLRAIKLQEGLDDKNNIIKKLDENLQIYLNNFSEKNNKEHNLFDIVIDYIEKQLSADVVQYRGKKQYIVDGLLDKSKDAISRNVKRMIRDCLIESLQKEIQKYLEGKLGTGNEYSINVKTLKTTFDNGTIENIKAFVQTCLQGKLGQDQVYAQDINKIFDQAVSGIDHPKLLLKLYVYLQRESGRLMLEDKLGVPEKDTDLSLFSLFFLKHQPIIDLQSLDKQLSEGLEKISKAAEEQKKRQEKTDTSEGSKSSEASGLRYRGKAKQSSSSAQSSSTSLTMDSFRQDEEDEEEAELGLPTPQGYVPIPIEDVTDLKHKVQALQDAKQSSEKMAMSLYALNMIPPKSLPYRFFEHLATYAQGAGHLGQTLLSYWTMQQILTLAGAGEMATFYGSLGWALGDVALKTFQELYTQKEAFLSLRKFGSRHMDYWPLRWISNVPAAISSAFYTMPIITAPFALSRHTSTPTYLKILIACDAAPADFSAEMQRHRKAWNQIIHGMSHLSAKCYLTTTQKRAGLNHYFDRAKEFVTDLDEESINQLFYYYQGGL